jgi:hypothetical protein
MSKDFDEIDWNKWTYDNNGELVEIDKQEENELVVKDAN